MARRLPPLFESRYASLLQAHPETKVRHLYFGHGSRPRDSFMTNGHNGKPVLWDQYLKTRNHPVGEKVLINSCRSVNEASELLPISTSVIWTVDHPEQALIPFSCDTKTGTLNYANWKNNEQPN